MAAVTVPQMAKVTPPIKRDMLPVIDPQLRICSSKVPPHLSMFDLRSARGLVKLFPVAGPSTASAPSCIGDATAEQGVLYIFQQPRFT